MAGRLPDPCRGPSPRREVLRIGGLGALGVGLGAIARPLRAADAAVPASQPRARNCIVLFLAGGPPQHETFDPKPAAPIEIRGPFLPVSTSVPGVAFCELLPRLARRADRLCVIRSMTTGIHSHSTSGCFMLTGHEPASVAENVPASAADWPSIAAAVGALRPADQGPLDAVVIPEPLVNNPAIPWPGQNGGFMGATWHPHLLRCDPAAARLEIDGLSVPAEAVRRLGARRGLLESLDGLAIPGSQGLLEAARVRSEAFDLLSAGATRRALEIERETEPTRDRYGRTKFGQSVLLARRLVEAGVRLVQVNYPREPGDTTSNNPLWDTHVDNAGRLERVLCPTFDMALAALLDDLAERGLLDDTLVVTMGEFGRTPRINPAGGRDHWGSVFSVALAGAGIPGGAVIGASDAHGAQPTLRPVRPPDLAATIFQLLGIAPATEFRDGLGRPLALVSGGEALTELVG